MKIIEQLNTELKNLEQSKSETMDKLKQEWFKVFDDCGEVQKVIQTLENGDYEHFYGDYDGVSGGIWSTKIDDIFENEPNSVMEFLNDYLRDFGIYRFDYNSFGMNLGPSIIINYESREPSWHCQDSHYTSELPVEDNEYTYCPETNPIQWVEIAKQINDYQESKGEFGWVFLQDYHGNLTPFSVLDVIEKGEFNP